MSRHSSVAKVEVRHLGNEVKRQPSERHPRRSWAQGISGPAGQYLVGRRAKKKLMRWQIFNLLRRLVVIAASIQYIIVSMTATGRTFEALEGVHNPPESFRVFTASLISGYVGNGLIRDSSLVHKVLENDTSPRDHAVFLEAKNKTSFQNCSGLPKFNPKIYNFEYLSHAYIQMASAAKYNVTLFKDFELVTVVVDCSFTNLKSGDNAMVRFFNLVRSRVDPTELYMVTMSLNVQDYEIRSQKKTGPCILTMILIVNDMGAGPLGEYYLMALTYPYKRAMGFEVYEFMGITIDSYLELRTVPEDPLTQPANRVITARKRGFYDGQEQSNIRPTFRQGRAGRGKTTHLQAA
ncbi:hypothetical protein PInf_010251 [Phytophthora infestans]|nr:hypothetical protein PInf_010251 [Phytophthora infestans]